MIAAGSFGQSIQDTEEVAAPTAATFSHGEKEREAVNEISWFVESHADLNIHYVSLLSYTGLTV